MENFAKNFMRFLHFRHSDESGRIGLDPSQEMTWHCGTRNLPSEIREVVVWVGGDGRCHWRIPDTGLVQMLQMIWFLHQICTASHAHLRCGSVFDKVAILIKHMTHATRSCHVLIVLVDCVQWLIAALQKSGHFLHDRVIHLTTGLHLFWRNGKRFIRKFGLRSKLRRSGDRKRSIGILFWLFPMAYFTPIVFRIVFLRFFSASSSSFSDCFFRFAGDSSWPKQEWLQKPKTSTENENFLFAFQGQRKWRLGWVDTIAIAWNWRSAHFARCVRVWWHWENMKLFRNSLF